MRPHKMGTEASSEDTEKVNTSFHVSRRPSGVQTTVLKIPPEEGGQMRATLREVLLYHGNISLPLWC